MPIEMPSSAFVASSDAVSARRARCEDASRPSDAIGPGDAIGPDDAIERSSPPSLPGPATPAVPPEKARLIAELFPNGLDERFAQGRLKDCSLLAAMRVTALFRPQDLVRSIAPPRDATKAAAFAFRVAGDETSIEVGAADVQTRGLRGALGFRLLETAYLRSLMRSRASRRPASEKAAARAGVSPEETTVRNGGSPTRALQALQPRREIFSCLAERRLSGHLPRIRRVRRLLREVAERPDEWTCVVATVKKPADPTLHGRHAYAVVDVDAATERLRVEDSYAPGRSRIVSYAQLFADFDLAVVFGPADRDLRELPEPIERARAGTPTGRVRPPTASRAGAPRRFDGERASPS